MVVFRTREFGVPFRFKVYAKPLCYAVDVVEVGHNLRRVADLGIAKAVIA
ncbi:MAG: hypothetical protein ACYTDT_12750 [Planctomycetota bacterium]